MLKFTSLSLTLLLLHLSSCQKAAPKTPVQLTQDHLILYSDSLDIALLDLKQAVESQNASSPQKKFEKARYYYKYLEPFTELYFPGFSEAINGPAIDESEVYEGKVVEASGFQVVEEYLYPEVDTSLWEDLTRETRMLASMTNRLKQLVVGNELTDAHIFQAIRLQLVRISSLGVSGFDSPISKNSIPEAVAALQGIQKVLLFYSGETKNTDNTVAQLNADFEHAYSRLNGKSNFDTFDRAAFIADDILAISKSVYNYQQELGIVNRDLVTAINLDHSNFFDSATFQLSFFANPTNRDNTPEMISLGQILFFDPILSGNNQRACASCHQPSKAFTDGRVKSLAFGGENEISRNAPTILNSAFQRMQFYDSRTMFQEDQITDVMANPQELHGQIDESVSKIKKSAEYQELFNKAFKGEGSISNLNVQRALASYVKSLSSMNSAFDRYMRGDKSSMPPEAISGFTLFMGKAKCGTCHFLPLFNGTVPPLYTKSESEVLGVPTKPDTINATVDSDLGKFLIFGGDLNKNAFKTPTVRNIALTAPYMHNGVFSTLEEVIDFYNRGGGEGIGIDLSNQTLPPDQLNLTEREKKHLIAFMHSLTDTTNLSRIPKRLPSFSDPHLKNRTIGGVY